MSLWQKGGFHAQKGSIIEQSLVISCLEGADTGGWVYLAGMIRQPGLASFTSFLWLTDS